jgi:hypothetical protein
MKEKMGEMGRSHEKYIHFGREIGMEGRNIRQT